MGGDVRGDTRGDVGVVWGRGQDATDEEGGQCSESRKFHGQWESRADATCFIYAIRLLLRNFGYE